MVSERERPNYRRVEEVVNDILDNNFIENPPVNAQRIAEDNGLRVVFVDFPDTVQEVSGFLDFSGQTIYVNNADEPFRQNFTIAHELGHWFLHRDRVNEYQVLMRRPIGGEKSSIEKEANFFAASLLVPGDMLLECRKKDMSNSEIAKKFKVTKAVIELRIADEQKQ